MRRLIIIAAASLLLISWWSYPYALHDNAQAQAAPATTRPVVAAELVHPNPFKELHGQTGFWRLGEDQSGVWWWVSPEGKLEFLNTVTTVQPEQEGRDRTSVRYLSTDWDGSYKPRNLDLWAKATLNA